MAKTKQQKQEILNGLKEKIQKQKSVVFMDFTSVNVKDLTEVRRQMKENDCEFKVAKKTLIQKAFQGFNQEIGDAVRNMSGEIAVGFGYSDQISPFKVSGDFSGKNENFKVLGGLIGDDFFSRDQAMALSKLPSRNEMLANVVGSISAPMSGFVNALGGNIRNLIYILNAIKGR